MEQVPISEFKAKCLAIVKEVQRTGKPVQITRFGKPVADLVPPMVARHFLLGRSRWSLDGELRFPATGARSARGACKLPRTGAEQEPEGSLIGSVTYLGDIVGPSSDPGEWEADR